ncbi:DUF2079 domain-containing protein [Bacteroidota bacterium]
MNHYYFRTNALDFGFYNQAFGDFAHFRSNANTVFYPALDNYLQVHPAFTLFILSPLYWVFNWIFGTYTLLIIQNIFLIIGGIYTYKIVKDKTQNNLLAVLALLHYHFIWGHYSAIAFEYIDATVASCIVPVFFYYFDKQKYLLSTIAFIFILTARENMPIWFIFISAFLVLIYYKRKRAVVFSVLYILFSLTYLVIVYNVIVPIYENESLKYWGFAYSALGENIPKALKFVFTHPLETFKLLFINHSGNPLYNGIKAEFYYVFLLSGGFLLFYRPKYIILFIPIIAQKMFNDHFVRWGINIFYSIEIVTLLPFVTFLIISDLGKIKKYNLTILFAIIILTSTFVTTIVKMNTRKSKWYDKSKEKFYDPKFYKSKYDLKKVYWYLENIRPETSVCASGKIVPHLAFRKEISMYPYIGNAEVIFILQDSPTYPLRKEEFEASLSNLKNNVNWELKIDDYPVLLFEKVNN